MTALYSHLSDLLYHDPNKISYVSTAFRDHKLIWVPDRSACVPPQASGSRAVTSSDHQLPAAGEPASLQLPHGGRQPPHRGWQLPGRFYEPGTVRWRDATNILESLPWDESAPTRVLSHAYGSQAAALHQLLCETLQRPRQAGGGGAAAAAEEAAGGDGGGGDQMATVGYATVPLVLEYCTIPDYIRALKQIVAGAPAPVTVESDAFRQVCERHEVCSVARDEGAMARLWVGTCVCVPSLSFPGN